MKNVWGKYTALILVIILILGSFSGCGGGPVEAEEENVASYHTKLYYVSSDYLETGDDSIEPMVVVESDLTIPVEDADEVYDAVLELLVTAPAEGNDTMVRQGMVDDVTVSNGVAVIDFNEEHMNGGSMEEVYLIEQVVRTLVKSFDEIQKVRFTVEGNEVDSLMGHLEASCTYGLIKIEESGTDVELVSIMED